MKALGAWLYMKARELNVILPSLLFLAAKSLGVLCALEYPQFLSRECGCVPDWAGRSERCDVKCALRGA